MITGLGDDLIQLVIVVPGGEPLRVEERDTVHPAAFGLTKSGDSVQPEIAWATLTAGDTIISLDAMTGRIAGEVAGSTAVQARSGTLLSDVIDVIVLLPSDTLEAVGETIDTVAALDDTSMPLTVGLRSFATTDTLGLTGRSVTFAFVEPAMPTVDFTGQPDTVAVTVTTDGEGLASVTLSRRAMDVAPDSVVLEARAVRATTGLTVPGSPVRFIIFFE